jgi:hypothetical protein
MLIRLMDDIMLISLNLAAPLLNGWLFGEFNMDPRTLRPSASRITTAMAAVSPLLWLGLPDPALFCSSISVILHSTSSMSKIRCSNSSSCDYVLCWRSVDPATPPISYY